MRFGVSVGRGVHAEDNHYEDEGGSDAAKVVLGRATVSWTERVVDGQDQVNAKTEIKRQRDQLEETVEDLITLAKPVH